MQYTPYLHWGLHQSPAGLLGRMWLHHHQKCLLQLPQAWVQGVWVCLGPIQDGRVQGQVGRTARGRGSLHGWMGHTQKLSGGLSASTAKPKATKWSSCFGENND